MPIIAQDEPQHSLVTLFQNGHIKPFPWVNCWRIDSHHKIYITSLRSLDKLSGNGFIKCQGSSPLKDTFIGSSPLRIFRVAGKAVVHIASTTSLIAFNSLTNSSRLS